MKKDPLIVTDRRVSINVIIPYSDVIELLDILDETTDPETTKTIQEGRMAINSGVKGIPVSSVFGKTKDQTKK